VSERPPDAARADVPGSDPRAALEARGRSPRPRGVVTVSRQYGAGGARVSRALAEAIGFRFVDREPVEMAARQLGVDPAWALEHDERVPDVLEDLGRTLAAATPELSFPEPPVLDDRAMADAVRNVIHSLADAGGFVILGRGAQATLSERDDVCSLLLVADEPERIARIVRWQDVDEREARARVERFDRERRDYVRRFYGADISDPILYDAVLNTSRIGLDGTVAVAEALVRHKLADGG
jgi:cytidylate kinase